MIPTTPSGTRTWRRSMPFGQGRAADDLADRVGQRHDVPHVRGDRAHPLDELVGRLPARARGRVCAGALSSIDEDEAAPPRAAWSASTAAHGGDRCARLGARHRRRAPRRWEHPPQPRRRAGQAAGARHGAGGGLAVPLDAAASTHILKLASRDHAALVENEALCLLLARRVGLAAVEADVRRVDDALVLLVQRYDRAAATTVETRRPRARTGTIVLRAAPRLRRRLRAGARIHRVHRHQVRPKAVHRSARVRTSCDATPSSPRSSCVRSFGGWRY